MGGDDAMVLNEVQLNVARWGNSLAVRIPVALARELGVREGDVLRVHSPVDGAWQLVARKPLGKLSREEWLRRAHEHLATMPRTQSVIREMRDAARY